jgi:hypothetical protein
MGLASQRAMIPPRTRCSIRIAAACLPFASAAFAGELPHDLPPSLVLIDAGVTHDLGAGIDGQGDVAVTRTRATIGFHRKLSDDWVLRGQVGGEHAHYDWSSDALFLGASDPWSEIWKVAPACR